MKKAIVTFIILISGFLTLFSVEVQTSEAAYTSGGAGFPLASGIAMHSPENTTYNSNMLTLNFSSQGMLSPTIYSSTMTYSIDGQPNVTIPVTSTFVPVEATRTYPNGTTATVLSTIFSYWLFSGCVALPQLPDGSHTLSVYARYDRINDVNTNWPKLLLDKNTVQFTVDDPTSNNTAVDNGKAINDAMAASNSGANVNAYQPTIPQTEITYAIAALLIVGLIVAALAIIYRRRGRIN